MTDTWTPTSWQQRVAAQLPVYADPSEVAAVVKELAALPPLVTSWEVDALRAQLAACARGEMFLLQGGDCAESFDSCSDEAIVAQVKILLQMSLVLVHGSRRKVVRVGRIAGQYAKPRSADEERRGDVALPSYRGDLLNRAPFTRADRTPDPKLMLRGYERAALTLNYIRALIDGGFADLHHPEYWDVGFVQHSPMRGDYEQIVATIRDSVEFMENVLDARAHNMSRAEIYTSHEGLALLYEQAQTRTVPHTDGYYNLSTHFPWIGMRTADPAGAHVEYFRGIRNPIGVKVGPGMTATQLTALVDVLLPDDEPGRLTLIHRMGVDRIGEVLPPLVEAVQGTGKTVTWVSDPMHGNTEVTPDGTKTRRFDSILGELEAAFRIHDELGSVLGGVHFEMTGDDVTECVGGARGLAESDLHRAYRTSLDPRLNYDQAMEMAMRIARLMRDHAPDRTG